jgi:Fic family protein
MAEFIHELPDWPRFTVNGGALVDALSVARHRQGRLIGRMESLGFRHRGEAIVESLAEEVIKSNEIEGNALDRDQVRSSVARRLGIDIGALKPADRNVDGIVDMTLDATQNYRAPLTAERLFGWHRGLFPGGSSGLTRITVGHWRDDRNGPMQVVSGPPGRERVHFQAPAAPRIDGEMRSFLDWFNQESAVDQVLRAGIAHLWFVTIHPFDDGNGRIARAIADMALARSEDSAQRFYGMSGQIRRERDGYYSILESTQRNGLDITSWLAWFLRCLDGAVAEADHLLDTVLRKAGFWRGVAGEAFNDRQRAMLNRLVDGFVGKLTTSKWAKIAKCSQDTALRDIDDLLRRGILAKDPGGGRSTSYSLVEIRERP